MLKNRRFLPETHETIPGLRTLVVAKRQLSASELEHFEKAYHTAKMSITDRSVNMAAVVNRMLEKDLQLLCLTGVEDRLQDQVTTSLELLRNAGIKIWMLTGDKLETAVCIAKSSGLFSRSVEVHIFGPVHNRTDAHNELNNLRRYAAFLAKISANFQRLWL